MNSTETYPHPVSQLFGLDFTFALPWPDFAAMGIGREHIPELLRLATDTSLQESEDDRTACAPLQAWRALGMLHAVEAIEPLVDTLQVLEDCGDWLTEEAADVLAMIGPPAIAACGRYLAESSNPLYPKSAASGALMRIARQFPDRRDECIGIIEKQLSDYSNNDPELNAFLISDLTDMGSESSLPLIFRAYAEGFVDSMIIDLAFIQGRFGIHDEELPSDLQNSRSEPARHRDFRNSLWFTPPVGGAYAKARKAKRKQQKLSRKKNRKKK